MSIRLDSMEAVNKLTKGDKIINPKTKERFFIHDVFEEFLIVSTDEERRAIKLISTPELISDHWEMEKDN